MQAALPLVVATLAAGKTVVCHCLRAWHRGPLVAVAIVLAVCPLACSKGEVTSVMEDLHKKWSAVCPAPLRPHISPDAGSH